MKLARLGSLLAIAALTVSCATATPSAGTGGTTTSTPAASSPTRLPQTSVPAVVELLDFEYPLLAGGTLRGADLAGKDVAFWFWAPW